MILFTEWLFNGPKKRKEPLRNVEQNSGVDDHVLPSRTAVGVQPAAYLPYLTSFELAKKQSGLADELGREKSSQSGFL